MKKIPGSFKKYFWDTKIEDIDLGQRQTYVIERLLEFGDTKAYRWLVKNFPKGQIKTVAATSRRVNPRTRRFWQIIP